MAVGRISGPLLSKNLLRDGIDLAFENNLLYLDVTNGVIGIKTSTPYSTSTLYADNIRLYVNGTGRLTNLLVDSTGTFLGTLSVGNTANATGFYSTSSANTGSVVIAGGVTIGKDIYVGGIVNADAALFNGTTATSTTTGAVQVIGGVGVVGSVYSADGGVHENNLLYTPNITITSTSTVAPPDPKVGDGWICTDPAIHAWLQFVQDGDQRFWIQVTSI